MGDMADFHMADSMADAWLEEMAENEKYEYAQELERKYMLGILEWTTREGEEINLTKMTEEHLWNLWNFLKEKEEKVIRSKWIELVGYEIEKRQ